MSACLLVSADWTEEPTGLVPRLLEDKNLNFARSVSQDPFCSENIEILSEKIALHLFKVVSRRNIDTKGTDWSMYACQVFLITQKNWQALNYL